MEAVETVFELPGEAWKRIPRAAILMSGAILHDG